MKRTAYFLGSLFALIGLIAACVGDSPDAPAGPRGVVGAACYENGACDDDSFGSAFVADRLGLRQGRWSYAAVDALFASADGPTSTQAVLRAGQDVDPIEATGLGALPFDVATDWTIENVDRIGEWYTYVLLYPAAGDKIALATQLHAWDGDQLLTLRKKDGSTPPSVTSPSAIVWTTIRDDAASATRFVEQPRGS